MTFQKKLLGWFEKNQRALPWRRHYRPYEVWISEIMLQQTQMDTVVPYFERWMKTFPNVEALARSDEKKVLKLWEGLGYYSRARNLHASAQEIMRDHGGIFPKKDEDILALKGIGRYTAGAIASIAFNREKPIVDGNILRVLSRVNRINVSIDEPANREIFWKLEADLIPEGQARSFNQALMELGALICQARSPRCLECPVSAFCGAFKEGDPEKYPVRRKRRASVKVHAAALVLSDKDRYLIRRRPVGQIMGGLWEFPEWKISKGSSPVKDIRRAATGLARKELGSAVGSFTVIGTIKRSYTHHLETLSIFAAERRAVGAVTQEWPSEWVPAKEFSKFPFSSAHAKIAAIIRKKATLSKSL